MSLPDEYLDYEKRRYGQDIDRYDWQLAKDRPRVRLTEGRQIAVMMVIPVEFHPLDPSGKPFVHPQGMKTPYPDLRHFTTRDYGNRVGIYRLLDAMAAHNIKATVPVSAAMLQRAPSLIKAVSDAGHEIAAAGLHTDAIHWGDMAADMERDFVRQTRDAFTQAGLSPTTWMSPARQQSRRTLDLIAEHGFTTCLDWEADQVPVEAMTDHGPVTLLPIHNELEDNKLIVDRRQTESVWKDQLAEAASFLKTETPRFGSQILGFQVTPFVMGQPFRIFAFRELCETFASDDALWTASASDIVHAFATALMDRKE